MMPKRCCQLLGVLLLSKTLFSLVVDACQEGPSTCSCDGSDWMCKSSTNAIGHTCQVEQSGSQCHQKCDRKFNVCKMNLTCRGGDCEQICKAKECHLRCNGNKCKKQQCENEVNKCEMHVGCKGGECEQICKAKQKCDMDCSGGFCKMQKCEDEVEKCKMSLACNSSNDCEQICKANTCEMKCSGGRCTKQECDNQVGNCTMHLRCSREIDCAQNCKNERECDMECFGCSQSCEATTCRMTRIWQSSFQDKLICSGNGRCCGILTSNINIPSLRTITSTTTTCGTSGSCTCTKYSKSLYSTSNLNTSNVVTSTKVKKTPVFTTNCSAEQGTQACTLQQSLMQSPLSLLSPSPLPSSLSSYSSLETITPAEASATSFAQELSSCSSSKPAAVSSAAASSDALSPLSSPSLSPPAASKSVVSSSSISSPSSSPSSVTDALISASAAASTSPSMWTSSTSTSGVTDNLLLQSIKVFEDFITSIQNITKRKEEIEMIRKSIFNAAIALEEFALNYGKNNLTDGNSSVKIDSHKLVLVIQKADRENAGEFYPRNQELQATMKLSSASFVNNVSVVVGIFYKDLHEILFIDQSFTIQTGNTRYLDSGIMAMAMDPKPEKLQENVILNFRNLNVRTGTILV